MIIETLMERQKIGIKKREENYFQPMTKGGPK